MLKQEISIEDQTSPPGQDRRMPTCKLLQACISPTAAAMEPGKLQEGPSPMHAQTAMQSRAAMA